MLWRPFWFKPSVQVNLLDRSHFSSLAYQLFQLVFFLVPLLFIYYPSSYFLAGQGARNPSLTEENLFIAVLARGSSETSGSGSVIRGFEKTSNSHH
jgi:hypothetical protein